MGFQIESGTGNSVSAEVNSENMLMVSAVATTPEHHINHVHGQAFVINFGVTPTGPEDCFFYLKNNGETEMIIEGFGLWLLADEYIDVRIGDIGSPENGAPLSPANCNSGSGQTIVGTIESGVDITGLSGGQTVYRYYHASSQGTHYKNFEMDLVIKKNSVLTLYCQTGTTALAGFINLVIHGEARG